jgi:hypothetical protein
MKKKFKIIFCRIGLPGSLIETEMYVETRDHYESDELKERIRAAFYCHFRKDKFAFIRIAEIPAPVYDGKGENRIVLGDGNPGGNFLREGEE